MKTNSLSEFLNFSFPSKKLADEFYNTLITENIKRLSLVLCIILGSQIIFAIAEFINGEIHENSMLMIRAITIGICILFITTICLSNRIEDNQRRYKALAFIAIVIQFASVLSGCYFVVNMSQDGFISFDAFYLVAFFVSLTCIRNPIQSGVSLFIVFAGLSAYLYFFVYHVSKWPGEFLIAILFVFLLIAGNILNYKRHMKLFLQEKEIGKINKELEYLAESDQLTGIYNRRKSQEIAEKHIALAQRYNDPFCVAILDIDRFKSVNDKFGHNVGDKVLKQFTEAIKSQLRSTDIFGRWGGEEFIILIPKSDTKSAFGVLEKLRKYIETFPFVSIKHITFSAGLCMYSGENNSFEIIARADTALYRAKDLGRNQIQICEKSI